MQVPKLSGKGEINLSFNFHSDVRLPIFYNFLCTKSEVNLTTALLGFQVLGTLLKFKDGLGKSFVETFFDRVENHLGA